MPSLFYKMTLNPYISIFNIELKDLNFNFNEFAYVYIIDIACH